ncbi:hypothetical protein C5Y96_22855 [Blastopirellula marina]|uniref:Cytochrome c domain-containing protein n=1 Tax=Blastopirellula marina TaxID=124 RepID=A0A2S8F157_9BACT|nr:MULTISPECIES: DUF1588 domain-containing protein [Pirellulaceae]PQO25664.1 hypothetical protein C5Y96_22855 [Blastopirellula marina]RCS43347.1 DUF1588 domain-containing protein [Bremerella cremea]
MKHAVSRMVRLAAQGAVLSIATIAAATTYANETSIQRYVTKYCLDCHGSDSPEGDVVLAELHTTTNVGLLFGTFDQSALHNMPPEDAEQPSSAERAEFLRSLDAYLKAKGHDRTSQPGNGNLIDHALLFTEPTVRKAATPSRIWRLDVDSFIERARKVTNNQSLFYDNRNNAKPVSLPYQTPDHTFLDFAAVHSFDGSTTEMLLLESDLIVNQFMSRQWSRYEKQARGDQHQLWSSIFSAMTGQLPEPGQLESLVELHSKSKDNLGEAVANRLTVKAILLRPHVLFRFELGAGEPDPYGRRYLSPTETAVALGYAVDVAGPDAKLTSAIEPLDLDDRQTLRSIMRPYLKTDAMQARLLRFAHEYFEYPRAEEVFKDADKYDYQPERLVDDADQFILKIIDEDQDVLRNWLTSRDYYVRGMFNYTGTKLSPIRRENGYKDYHRNYNLAPELIGKNPEWFELPPAERAGILTHPAWLLAFSDNEKNQAIQRGRWVTTKLLGGMVPDAPVEVDARLPEDESLTLREKMHVTKASQCIHCHRHMDPLGLPFEQYDLFGQFRTEEKEKPVVTTGTLWGNEVPGPIPYVTQLAQSRQTKQVFLRHVFRFFMGRNETIDDAPTLIDMETAYDQSHGSLKATVLSLLTSDSFLYRVSEPAMDNAS